MSRRGFIRRTLGIAAALALATGAGPAAAEYPDHPIRWLAVSYTHLTLPTNREV